MLVICSVTQCFLPSWYFACHCTWVEATLSKSRSFTCGAVCIIGYRVWCTSYLSLPVVTVVLSHDQRWWVLPWLLSKQASCIIHLSCCAASIASCVSRTAEAIRRWGNVLFMHSQLYQCVRTQLNAWYGFVWACANLFSWHSAVHLSWFNCKSPPCVPVINIIPLTGGLSWSQLRELPVFLEFLELVVQILNRICWRQVSATWE